MLAKQALYCLSHLQSILLWLFFENGKYFPGLALNHDHPDFGLPSS
jgi:hypothetical protein